MTRELELQTIINEAQIELAQLQRTTEEQGEDAIRQEMVEKLEPLGFTITDDEAIREPSGFTESVTCYSGQWFWDVTEDETGEEIVSKSFSTLDALVEHRTANMPKAVTYRVTYEFDSIRPAKEVRAIIEGDYSAYYGQDPTIEVIS